MDKALEGATDAAILLLSSIAEDSSDATAIAAPLTHRTPAPLPLKTFASITGWAPLPIWTPSPLTLWTHAPLTLRT